MTYNTAVRLNAAVAIQVRMSSTRLPGKALLTLAGRRMLHHIVARLGQAPVMGPIVIATSTQPADDFICSWSNTNNITCFRGSELDVLDRFWRAAENLDVKYIVRATGDNPLVWEEAVAHLGRHIIEQKCEYIAYTGRITLGLGLEIFTKEALRRAHDEAVEPYQREHVTIYLYENKDRFDTLHISPPPELESDFRLTVDTDEDYALMKEIYARLYKPGEIVRSVGALELLRREPKLAEINSKVRQKNPHSCEIKETDLQGGGA